MGKLPLEKSADLFLYSWLSRFDVVLALQVLALQVLALQVLASQVLASQVWCICSQGGKR